MSQNTDALEDLCRRVKVIIDQIKRNNETIDQLRIDLCRDMNAQFSLVVARLDSLRRDIGELRQRR